MPYIIFTANGEELDRRDLIGPLTIGRSTECDVRIHDILMSRKHCRIELDGGRGNPRWKLVDLDSKNGSHFNWKRISEHVLFDGDSVRLGRTYLQFRAGAFVAGTVKSKRGKTVRPADPNEALTGTISDFVLLENDGNDEEFDAAPSPRNRPAGPSDKVASVNSVLEDLSSSWDSIVTTVTKPPRRAMARPLPNGPVLRSVGKRVEADLSLQAAPQHLPYLEMIAQPLPRRYRYSAMRLLAAGIGICLATLVVLYSGWLMMKG